MPSLYSESTIAELKSRIDQIDPSASPLWGKMTAYQMVRHCILAEQLYLGQLKEKRTFIGRLFGKIALRQMLKPDSQAPKNSPTHPKLVIKDSVEIGPQIQEWKTLLDQYPGMAGKKDAKVLHPFFGTLDHSQIDTMAYKHIDHHLRQFGV